jgi:hypothetical protein
VLCCVYTNRLQFKYIDLKPDPKNESCHASYWNVSKLDTTAKYVERDGQWHHLAVTWSTADEGLTKIYWDGLLVASAFSHKTKPLEPGGAFMLGAEQVRAWLGAVQQPQCGVWWSHYGAVGRDWQMLLHICLCSKRHSRVGWIWQQVSEMLA